MGKTYRRSNDDYGYNFGSPKSLREKRRFRQPIRKGWSNVNEYDTSREYDTIRKQMPAEDRGEWT